jgi:hypothetical protein
MNELSKRWVHIEREGGSIKWILKEKGRDWNRALVGPNSLTNDWKLQVWDGHDWGEPINVPTLRAAKALGRILATTAATNF